MSRIAGGLGGTRHCPLSRQGILPHKRGPRPNPVHAPFGALSVSARSAYERAHVAGYGGAGTGLKCKSYGSNHSREGQNTTRREDGRPSEDDVAQEHLGWRGQKGRPDTATMTEDSKLQTPFPLTPATRLDGGGATAPKVSRSQDRYPAPTIAESNCPHGCGSSRRAYGRSRKTPPKGGLKYWDDELRGS